MPDTQVVPLTSALKQSQTNETTLANSVLHLYKVGFSPSPSSVLADFTSQECDFDGYAPVTVTSTGAPFAFGTGYAVETQQRFNFDSGSPASGGNQVGGWYWVSAAGVLMEYGTFDPTRPAQMDGQAIFVSAILPVGSGQVI